MGGFAVRHGLLPIVVPGVPPQAPTNLQLILQGQNSAGQNTGSPPTPNNANRIDIAWTAAVAGLYPVASYNIYRSVNGGSYSLYAQPGGTGTTYSDTAATLSTNGTAGAGPIYYPANTYQYQVSAVDIHGNEGAQSGSQSFTIYQNGVFNWGGDFDYGGLTSAYNDTTGVPQGGVGDILNTVNGAYGGWLPYAGNLTTKWNMWVGAFNYISLDLKPSVINQLWNIFALRVGDVSISRPNTYSNSVTNYGPAPAVGVWKTYKIPLVVFLEDNTSGSTVLQQALYKFAISDQTGLATNHWFVDNVILSAT